MRLSLWNVSKSTSREWATESREDPESLYKQGDLAKNIIAQYQTGAWIFNAATFTVASLLYFLHHFPCPDYLDVFTGCGATVPFFLSSQLYIRNLTDRREKCLRQAGLRALHREVEVSGLRAECLCLLSSRWLLILQLEEGRLDRRRLRIQPCRSRTLTR